MKYARIEKILAKHNKTLIVMRLKDERYKEIEINKKYDDVVNHFGKELLQAISDDTGAYQEILGYELD